MTRVDVRLSKFLARILRHAPASVGLILDREGWGEVEGVLEAARERRLADDGEDIRRVVASNNKKRFELSSDGRRIRAVQGHSTPVVDRRFDTVPPPEFLFHGTAASSLSAIRAAGLRPGTRHYVHLSADRETAIQVGRRHGLPVVLTVAAARMARDGHHFHLAENGVWLTKSVPPQYLHHL